MFSVRLEEWALREKSGGTIEDHGDKQLGSTYCSAHSSYMCVPAPATECSPMHAFPAGGLLISVSAWLTEAQSQVRYCILDAAQTRRSEIEAEQRNALGQPTVREDVAHEV